MKREEAEPAIRHLCHEWRKERGLSDAELQRASYSEFRLWCDEKGYSRYFGFRSRMGAEYDAELWFDEEFKLTWQR